MDTHLPLIAIELVLVLGGALLFGWWQLREIKRDRRKAAEDRAAREPPARGPDADPPATPD